MSLPRFIVIENPDKLDVEAAEVRMQQNPQNAGAASTRDWRWRGAAVLLRLSAVLWLYSQTTGSLAAQTSDAIAQAIASELDSLTTSGGNLHGAELAMTDLVQQFYARRDFRPAWIDPRVEEQLRKALRDSFTEGLDPGDYHVPLLESLSPEATASPTARARTDILLTDALLRLGYHLSFGKVDPHSYDPQWNYGRTLASMDVAAEIEQAIATQDVYRRIEALKPAHPLYSNLRKGLARYRELEREGGWTALPPGPTLKPGMSDERVIALRRRLAATRDLTEGNEQRSALYDSNVEQAVRRFQQRMGLDVDGAVGPATARELDVPVQKRIEQLRVNLDRGRVLLHDLPPRFVVVNIAGFAVYLMDGDRTLWSARAQVGRPYRKTPIFRSEINYLVLNPTWTVPPGIIRNDILPAAQRDPQSIARKGLKVLDSNGRAIDPASVDWSRFSSGHIPYTLRQDPGPDNALGRVKLMFPNPYLVYLHDTPSQGLFERADRTFSSGCVRVENALQLAERVLDDPQRWNTQAIAETVASGKLQNVTLRQKMPVLLTYWTAWVDTDGHVNFRRDVYERDRPWADALNAPFRLRNQPVFAESTPTSE